MMKLSLYSAGILMTAGFLSCQSPTAKSSSAEGPAVKLITLDPGHFHAALVQKSMYPGVDSVVQVYAPDGNDVKLHLEKIEAYNHRSDNPTHWKEVVYLGDDYLQKMIAE